MLSSLFTDLSNATQVTWEWLKSLPTYFSLSKDCSRDDLQRIRTEEEKFIFTELFARARDNGANISRVQMPFSPWVATWSFNILPSNILCDHRSLSEYC